MEDESKVPLLQSSASAVNYDSMEDSTNQSAPYSRTLPQPVNRKPFFYPLGLSGSIREDRDASVAATYTRYRYYNKLLAGPSQDILTIPDHIVPSYFFYPFPTTSPPKGKQSSIVTIFSIWNTMMGTSLLCIPFAIQQAGFVAAIFILFIMGAICLYTAARILSIPPLLGEKKILEFSEVCRDLLGRWGEWVSIIFSITSLLGGAIVYWVLMNNFLYFAGLYVYESVTNTLGNSSTAEVLCPSHDHHHLFPSNATAAIQASVPLFYQLWKTNRLVPAVLCILMLPIVSLKSAGFFAKFNALGTLSVIYLIGFVSYKGYRWGLHFDMENPSSMDYVPAVLPSFPTLTGVLSLAFFIHNCIISLLRNQKDPSKNTRDLCLGYLLVGLTYLIIGFVFYLTFPLAKTCIEDNFLNNFSSKDVMALVTRVVLLFQLITLFPLILYILRIQTLHFLFGAIYPNFVTVLVLNLALLVVCNLFSIFLPKVGIIIRFSGAMSGLAYIFTLPSLTYIMALRRNGTLRTPTLVLHLLLICVGVANFISQFVITV